MVAIEDVNLVLACVQEWWVVNSSFMIFTVISAYQPVLRRERHKQCPMAYLLVSGEKEFLTLIFIISKSLNSQCSHFPLAQVTDCPMEGRMREDNAGTR